MTPEMLAIIAIVVSGLSLFVSGGCLFVAYAAKHQAKNAAMLKQPNEAIAHLRAALSALKEHRAVTNAAAQNITKAKDLADLFNPALRSVLGSCRVH
jgi:Tfp pilus assembly protein PilN